MKDASPADLMKRRQYNFWIVALMIAYASMLVLANWAVPLAGSPGRKLALSVLPALPIIGVFIVMGRQLIALGDEYIRMLMVRKMLVATGFTLSLASIWGFGEDFGVLPHMPAYYAVVVWFGGLGLGACVNAWLERREVAA